MILGEWDRGVKVWASIRLAISLYPLLPFGSDPLSHISGHRIPREHRPEAADDPHTFRLGHLEVGRSRHAVKLMEIVRDYPQIGE